MIFRHQTELFLPWKQRNIPIFAEKTCRTPLWNPAGFVCLSVRNGFPCSFDHGVFL